ncbi:SulP family inorganic anion transporter [Halalkalibacter krulwichiae]|uniref:Putative sulfate transporter/MT1781 n=1 Tax=Halalkalibacter krulwichiae TaxID=199441 RepID=A0A1X9MFL0_9BACI|nr:SulP family inorganic anion transporter [Halalkalibacter krulwichiae]ARK32238.1 putative sulfate transporter/MT1781 [Halalkalibacter krulwichiae]
MLFKMMPGLERLIQYNKTHFFRDLTAGIIVAVLFIPQSMAYATVAGVPLVIGLYAATLPLIVYALFGSSKHLSVGPVSIVSLLAFSGIASIAQPNSADFLELILLLGFMVGVIHLLLGLLKTGFIFNYISPTVITGFISACAIIIALNQVKSLLGISLPPYHDVFSYTVTIIHEAATAHPDTVLLGVGSLIFLLMFKKVNPILGPLFVIVLSILIVPRFGFDERGVELVGVIPSGLPQFQLHIPNVETIQLLLPLALMIAFISFLESFAVAKTIAAKEKDTIRPNQELVGLGLANISSSFVGAIPVAGALSRTAVNYESGAKTNLSLLITAGFVLVTLLYLTPLFYYLPKATLAAIIILAVSSLIQLKHVPTLFRHSPLDAIILLSTFLATLVVDIFIGLLTGIFISIVFAAIRRMFLQHA